MGGRTSHFGFTLVDVACAERETDAPLTRVGSWLTPNSPAAAASASASAPSSEAVSDKQNQTLSKSVQVLHELLLRSKTGISFFFF